MTILEPELASVLLVAVGGFLGGVARYWLSGVVARRIGESFPWGTLAVNGTGALAIGLLAGIVSRPEEIPGGELIWIALTVGILGSYTTVSSFSLQTLALVRDRQWRLAVLNVAGSLVLCLAAATAGLLAGVRIMGG